MELAKKAAGGDDRAFEELVHLYEKRVYNMALKITGSAEDAFDLSQGAFIRVWKSLKTFKGEAKFSTWLFRIVTNLCTDYIRKQSRRGEASLVIEGDDESFEYEPPDERTEPERELSRKELRRELDYAISQLSEEHRSVFVLREIDDLSYAEIADVLGVEEGTVKSRLSRARQRLREILVERGNIPDGFASKEMKGGDKP